jgi:hypothetical protein
LLSPASCPRHAPNKTTTHLLQEPVLAGDLERDAIMRYDLGPDATTEVP